MTWVDAACALCGDGATTLLFAFSDAAAPGGTAKIVRCRRCGLRRLDPRPDAIAIKEHYGEGYYTSEGRTRSRLKQQVWDRLRDLSSAPPSPGILGVPAALAAPMSRRVFDVNIPIGVQPPRVIDVGCGFGDLLIYLRQRGCDVLGIESDPAAARVGAAVGVPIHTGELADLDLEPASFDVAVMSHSLEHLEDPVEALTRLASLLRPSGALHLAVPNGAAPGLALHREAWGALCYPVHFWYFDPYTLSSLLAKAGFVVVWSSSTDIVPHHVAFWRERIREEPSAGLRELGGAISRRLRTPLTGDVLRVVARKQPEPAPASGSERW